MGLRRRRITLNETCAAKKMHEIPPGVRGKAWKLFDMEDVMNKPLNYVNSGCTPSAFWSGQVRSWLRGFLYFFCLPSDNCVDYRLLCPRVAEKLRRDSDIWWGWSGSSLETAKTSSKARAPLSSPQHDEGDNTNCRVSRSARNQTK